MDQFSQTFLIIPACLMLFFIYKKFLIKDPDRKTISDTLVVAILLSLSLYFYTKNTAISISAENFRAKTNF